MIFQNSPKIRFHEPRSCFCDPVGFSYLQGKDWIGKPAQIASNRHKDTNCSKSKFILFKLRLGDFFGILRFPYKPYKSSVSLRNIRKELSIALSTQIVSLVCLLGTQKWLPEIRQQFVFGRSVLWQRSLLGIYLWLLFA